MGQLFKNLIAHSLRREHEGGTPRRSHPFEEFASIQVSPPPMHDVKGSRAQSTLPRGRALSAARRRRKTPIPPSA